MMTKVKAMIRIRCLVMIDLKINEILNVFFVFFLFDFCSSILFCCACIFSNTIDNVWCLIDMQM